MSARKIESTVLPQAVSIKTRTTQLDLPASSVRIRKNGIEFRSETPIPVWTEMTVALQTPNDSRKVNFNGVVVACSGNVHAGFAVSLLFTSLSRQAQARLHSMTVAP